MQSIEITKKHLALVMAHVSTDETRLHVSSLLLLPNGVLVGTDGHRLAAVCFDVDSENPAERIVDDVKRGQWLARVERAAEYHAAGDSFLIPREPIARVLKACGAKETIGIRWAAKPDGARFVELAIIPRFQNAIMATPFVRIGNKAALDGYQGQTDGLVDAAFPPFRQVIPVDHRERPATLPNGDSERDAPERDCARRWGINGQYLADAIALAGHGKGSSATAAVHTPRDPLSPLCVTDDANRTIVVVMPCRI